MDTKIKSNLDTVKALIEGATNTFNKEELAVYKTSLSELMNQIGLDSEVKYDPNDDWENSWEDIWEDSGC